MSSNGAVKLQKIIKGLQDRDALNGVALRGVADNQLWIEKRSPGPDVRTEFSFQIRVDRIGGKETWWPVSYCSASGDVINCETVSNGKTLTNVSKQDVLIELAESWAKTLEAELVAKTIDNVLR